MRIASERAQRPAAGEIAVASIVYLGGTSDNNPFGFIRVDTSGVVDPYAVYAYDNSGSPLPLGSTISAVPEPSTTALAGLGALVLGAAGLRRWRKAKQAAGG